MENATHAESPNDQYYMQEAIRLAALGQGYAEPNPMVGCVLVRDGTIIGKGYHRKFGGPHAEIDALSSLGTESAVGATAYVSLEPCCHHGKTPPCTESLIESGVKRVVFAMEDPFPKVSGGGAVALRDAGIEVTGDVMRDEASLLNAPYIKRTTTGKPWVIAKWAMTGDGKIATRTGDSQWITNPESRLDVHRTRSKVDGILTGMGTVRADNPMLDARLADPEAEVPRVARRIVFCRTSIPSMDSKLLSTAKEIPVELLVGPSIDEKDLSQAERAGAKIKRIETENSKEFINAGLLDLGNCGMTNLLIEAGGELLASFVEADEIDEYHIYVGAMLLGNQQALSPLGGVGVDKITQATRLKLQQIETHQEDVKIVYRRLHSKDERR